MRKKKIFFFIFYFFLINFTFFDIKAFAAFEECTEFKKNKSLISQDGLRIDFIEIDINKYRQWTKNNIKILTSNSRYIDQKYKKRFKGLVTITFDDKSKCTYKASIRQSGDAKDHINYENNLILQSLDVSLEDGNIRGITKFKLFMPKARGNIDDLIILGQLLRDLGYLAPRSFRVKARINETESLMLFQEKAVKEMLEFNKRREGPILESDQKFFFDLSKKIPDNNLSNWSVRIPFLQNKTTKGMLVKSTNGKLVERNIIEKKIFLNAIEKLNFTYLYWANRFQDEKNNFFFFDYDIDNNLLSNFDQKKSIHLDIYNILLQSTNSQHALSLSNRKFFWNGNENYFEPILYDSNVEIELDSPTTTTSLIRYPISKYFFEASESLKKSLKKIDTIDFKEKIDLYGSSLDKIQLQRKLDKIYNNLEKIIEIYSKNLNQDLVSHNEYKIIENSYKKFNDTLLDISPSTSLILYGPDNNFKQCEIYFKNCKLINLETSDIIKLIDGNLKIKENQTVFYGSQPNLVFENSKEKKLNFFNLENTTIFFDLDIDVEVFKEKKIINIYQKKSGSKVYIKNGQFKDYTINFFGNNKKIKTDKNYMPPNFPIDEYNFTGCVTFLNLKIENLNLNISDSSCEDSINFINVSGNINNINIKNAFQDGLDADYSNLEISKISINNSGNDCIDLSAGTYYLKELIVNNCGDKGLSVGEKAQVGINKAIISKSNIGVASKDSSVTKSEYITIKDSRTCIAAYNKKQEFFGGYLEVKKLNCEGYEKISEKDKFSIISIN